MSHETYTFGQYAGIVEDDYNQQMKFDFDGILPILKFAYF